MHTCIAHAYMVHTHSTYTHASWIHACIHSTCIRARMYKLTHKCITWVCVWERENKSPRRQACLNSNFLGTREWDTRTCRVYSFPSQTKAPKHDPPHCDRLLWQSSLLANLKEQKPFLQARSVPQTRFVWTELCFLFALNLRFLCHYLNKEI